MNLATSQLPDHNMVEPENNYQSNVEYFHAEIVKQLTENGFYSFTYPTDAVNCLNQQDIVEAMFNTEEMVAIHERIMFPQNNDDPTKLIAELKKMAIERLADHWCTEEASRVPEHKKAA